MNYMISIILRAICITIISACDLHKNSGKNNYRILAIKMQACQIKKDAEIEFLNKTREVVIFGRIYSEDILNMLSFNENLTDLAQNIENSALKYSDCLSKYKKYFVKILASELKKIEVFFDAKKFERLHKTNIRILETELLLQNSNSSFSLNDSIKTHELFYDFRSKVQYIFWRLFNSFCSKFKASDMFKIISEKETNIYAEYADHSIVKSYKHTGVWIRNYKTYNDQTSAKDSIYDACAKKEISHLMIDLTYLFIDALIKNSGVIKTEYKPKMICINSKDFEKEIFELIKISLTNIFTDAYVHKKFVYNKSSIIFDFITVLEYININLEASQQIYNQIIDLCKFVFTKIQVITEELEKIHAAKIQTEIVGTFEYYILKIMSHRNIKDPNSIIFNILDSEFLQELFVLLPEFLKNQSSGYKRWFFENKLPKGIIDTYKDKESLLNFYNNVKILTENATQNHSDTDRPKYKWFLNYIGQICIKILAYNGNFYGKTEFNFFHNINEISKLKNFSTKKYSIKIETLWKPETVTKRIKRKAKKELNGEIFVQSQEKNAEFSEAVSEVCGELAGSEKTKDGKEISKKESNDTRGN